MLPTILHSAARPVGGRVISPGSGRYLLTAVALGLVLSGSFALLLAATRQLLPHDVAYLGVVAGRICGGRDNHILHFMFHDRAAFGGAVVATGLLYGWLVWGPLRQGLAWAWWTLALSGVLGFSSFLAYLGYGYFDAWHGAATALLLPLFGLGLIRSFAGLREPRQLSSVLRPSGSGAWRSRAGIGRACLLAMALGMVVAGLVIVGVGMTRVFVPQDLHYLNLTTAQLMAMSPRLVPLIAHDRAGFGGALASCGLAMGGCVWCAPPSRGRWWTLALAGGVGFATAIGVHPLIGYTDFSHLAPAFAGLGLFIGGLWLSSGTGPASAAAGPAESTPAVPALLASPAAE